MLITEKTPKPKNGGKKTTAVLVAIGVHIGIAVIAAFIAVMPPLRDEPEIVAQVVAPVQQRDMKIQKKAVQKQAKQASSAAASSSVARMIKANAVAKIGVPNVKVFTKGPVGLGTGDFGDGFGSGGGGSGMFGGMVPKMPTGMSARCSPSERLQRLKESGAPADTEKAVTKALDFLVKNQNNNGSFGKEYPVAITSLSLLAFLGHCETPDSPKFGKAVTTATLYLMEMAQRGDKGAICSPGGKPAYENAIAAYSLCEMAAILEASGTRKIPRLESAMKQAVRAVIEGQDETGGWYYKYAKGQGGDTSVSGWNFQALKSANLTKKVGGIGRALDRAAEYFLNSQTREGGFAYQPSKSMENRSGLGGVGAMALMMWDPQRHTAATDRAFTWLDANRLGQGGMNTYDWYYSTQAYFFRGGSAWKKWNAYVLPRIVKSQRGDGSFQGGGGHAPKDGLTQKIYHTAMCTLMLEVYYRYLPTSQKNLGNR